MSEPNDYDLPAFLRWKGLPESTIQDVTGSGYIGQFIRGSSQESGVPVVMDTFYGNKMLSGILDQNGFAEYLRGNNAVFKKAMPHEYQVSSIKEVAEILGRDENRKYFSDGVLTFRGQPEDYFHTRRVPNPVQRTSSGAERTIIPSWWRGQRDLLVEERYDRGQSVFKTMIVEPLIYYGIPDWIQLTQRKCDQYGVSFMSEFQEIDDPECQLLYDRWATHKLEGPFIGHFPAIEQHYGMRTPFLDLTFEPGTAFFFATHDTVKLANGKQRYIPFQEKRDHRVVYAFVFEQPRVRLTSDLITELNVFQHLPPQRPLRQKCALRSFNQYQINEAVADLHAVFHVKDYFDIRDLPLYEHLFPSPDEDRFYRELLNLKDKVPEMLDEIVEYEYS